MSKLLNLEPAVPGRRRRFTPEQKRALLDEAALYGSGGPQGSLPKAPTPEEPDAGIPHVRISWILSKLG